MKEIPKIYIVSNGNDGKEILDYLKSLGGKNRFYGGGHETFVWKPRHISEGNSAFINEHGDISIMYLEPKGYTKIELPKATIDYNKHLIKELLK